LWEQLFVIVDCMVVYMICQHLIGIIGNLLDIKVKVLGDCLHRIFFEFYSTYLKYKKNRGLVLAVCKSDTFFKLDSLSDMSARNFTLTA